MPEARVFRPQSEKVDSLIEGLMKVHTLEGHIQRPSWTQYVGYLINKDLAEERLKHKQRVGGR